ncbi:MAG: IPM/Hcit synthase-like protein [Thermoanaerobacterales bacterium 50_218]|nr:MAG: IPM/Hcit synthase-like protein [Thermoanaerobacterales bacterium 50_218]HAA90088.1 citramalate synthase [Peptococcaceae bacterium]
MRSCGDLKVYVYDTTLRDGAQAEGISLTVQDKLKITEKLDELGIPYIEGGWPGSNPKDMDYFHKVRQLSLKRARVCAFGSTRKAGVHVAEDANIRALLEAETPVVTIFGKSWDLHVYSALQTSLEENLKMIRESIIYLKQKKKEVIYDAEHFFDGFKSNPKYALETLKVAAEAGADWIVLCDTNGGTLPHEIEEIIGQVLRAVNRPLGIHAHNDGELAVANTIAAVRCGVRQVQGTINGFGERCGNANLCSVIPNLQLKLGYQCLEEDRLSHLTEVSHYIGEIANIAVPGNQPFVGHSAFAHKGGVHVSAILKNTRTYEHIEPELVGNKRRVLVSELAGSSNLYYKARELGLNLEQDKPKAKEIIAKIKELEYQGYQFEGADASFELLLKRAFGQYREFFTLESLKILVEKRPNDGDVINSEAMIKIRVGDQVIHTAAEGNGPVNALDNALRKALEDFYPELKEMHLVDYKVRVLDGKDGTGAKVRVLIESADSSGSWSTVGVSENIIEASWQALTDSMNYALLKRRQQP